jgi:NTE family protein
MFGIGPRPGSPPPAEPAPKQPRRLALALGSGAARGWAHIGVMRAFDEAGLKPDIVVGTSIGALVGGCWAAGQIEELEHFARGLTRRRVLGLLDLNFSGSGLISGTRLSKLLTAALGDRQIESLPVRYVCVAAELGTGHEVWITRGRLVDAMRASYAMPGIFQPVLLGERWLVDGAIVNPLPVSVCRALGADIVVAVNLNSEIFGRGTVIQDHSADALAEAAIRSTTEGLPPANETRRVLRRHLIGSGSGPPGLSSVMVQAFNIIQDRITRSRLAGDPPDALVAPRLGRIGLFEFHNAAEAISIGYETARRMTDEIRAILADTA